MQKKVSLLICGYPLIFLHVFDAFKLASWWHMMHHVEKVKKLSINLSLILIRNEKFKHYIIKEFITGIILL